LLFGVFILKDCFSCKYLEDFMFRILFVLFPLVSLGGESDEEGRRSPSKPVLIPIEEARGRDVLKDFHFLGERDTFEIIDAGGSAVHVYQREIPYLRQPEEAEISKGPIFITGAKGHSVIFDPSLTDRLDASNPSLTGVVADRERISLDE
jgi:hypothetical protein